MSSKKKKTGSKPASLILDPEAPLKYHRKRTHWDELTEAGDAPGSIIVQGAPDPRELKVWLNPSHALSHSAIKKKLLSSVTLN